MRAGEPAGAQGRDLEKPKERLDKREAYVATVKTTCGTFEITLDAKRAPKTGGSFKHLADEGVYDGTTFHRVEPGFVIQGGDPAGNGTGGPGYSIVEPPPGDLTYDKGVVAMAKTETEPGHVGQPVLRRDRRRAPPAAGVRAARHRHQGPGRGRPDRSHAGGRGRAARGADRDREGDGAKLGRAAGGAPRRSSGRRGRGRP